MAGDDIQSKLDMILLSLGQMSQRCDRMDKQLDGMESTGGKTPNLDNWDGNPETEPGAAKRLAADAARYTKYGSNCNPGFADSVSVDPIQAMSLEANELRAKLRKVEAAQKTFVSAMRPLDASEEAEMREFQARADDVYHAAGDEVRCPAPLAYERPSMFKVRVLSDLARHSSTWKNCSDGGLESLPPAGLRAAGDQILNEAKAAFKRGDHWPKDILAPHVHVDPANGMRTTTFTGPIFTRQFKPPGRVMRIRDPKELRADTFMNR